MESERLFDYPSFKNYFRVFNQDYRQDTLTSKLLQCDSTTKSVYRSVWLLRNDTLILESKVRGDSIRTYFPDSAARMIFWDFHEIRKRVGNGYVFNQEYSKARLWLQEIPAENDPDMLCLLGELFLEDEQDSLGLALLAKAAAMDSDRGVADYQAMMITASRRQEGLEYLKSLAAKDNIAALNYLGDAYTNMGGRTMPKDWVRGMGIPYYERAIELGDLGALYHLAHRLRYSDLEYKTPAWKLMQMGAERNDWLSMEQFGIMLIEGEGVEQDTASGIEWLLKSVPADPNGHKDGYSYLGKYYFEGKYLKRNLDKAIYYFCIGDRFEARNELKALEASGIDIEARCAGVEPPE